MLDELCQHGGHIVDCSAHERRKHTHTQRKRTHLQFRRPVLLPQHVQLWLKVGDFVPDLSWIEMLLMRQNDSHQREERVRDIVRL